MPAGPSASTASEQREARKVAARLERQLGKLSARETALHDRLAAAAGEGADHVQLATLSAELDAVVAERTLLEDQWLQVAEVADG